MNYPAFPLSKTVLSTLFSVLMQAQASPGSAAKNKKGGAGYAVLVEGDSPGSWERLPLEIGLSQKVKEDMLAEDGKRSDVRTQNRRFTVDAISGG